MAQRSSPHRFESWVEQILRRPDDEMESLLLKKRFWLSIFPSPFIMAFFGSFFWLLGSRSLAIGMWLFGVVMLIILFLVTVFPKHIKWYLLFNQYFFLIFSFVAVLYFGGILKSGGVVFVGLVGALGALSFLEPQQYRIMFYLYFFSVILEGILQPYLIPRSDITPTINLLSFILHILIIGVSMYKTLSYYIEQTIKTKQLEADKLRELDALKTHFYTNISHEFRTPLTVILGMIEQIAEKPKIYLQSGLQLIRRNGNQLLHLVNEMLDLSKLEAGHISLNSIQSNIVTYIWYLAEPFENVAEEKNICWHFQSDLDKIIMDFDPDKIQSLINNLLSNAIKNSLNGSNIFLKVGITNEMSLKSKRGFSLFPERSKPTSGKIFFLQIKDTGKGIHEHQIRHIFDRFYQVGNQGSNAGGAGIGLSLVKEIVNLMNGNLIVESKVGQGTSFSIYIPIKNDAPISDLPLEETVNEPLQYNKNIEKKWLLNQGLPLLLIVEDNPDVIEYVKGVLEQHYQIQVATTGKEGINSALEIIPDIILSDVMMPEKDGFELCKVLKKDFRTSHIPIILLTAKADISSKIEGLEIGADAYLTKPFHKEELLVRLRKLIEIRKKLQNRYKSAEMPLPTEDLALQQEDAFIKKIKDLVEKNVGEEGFGIPQLCQELAISRAQLYRKFEALTNLSVGKYIRVIRLQKAKELLQKNGLNVTEAAFEVGFNSLSHFSAAFKKEFGFSPSEINH